MKHRKNAVYTGQHKRGVVVESGDRPLVHRALVDELYGEMSLRFDQVAAAAEIEIVPPEQVNPTRSLSDQGLLITDYCVRKIVPEITSLYHWGVAVTPQLRALAPIVDRETAAVAHQVLYQTALMSTRSSTTLNVFYIIDAARLLAEIVCDNREKPQKIKKIAERASGCICNALILAAQTDSDLAYDNIMQYTNEMLEAL